MAENFPPRPNPLQSAEMQRRQQGRNMALMLILVALVILFFAITLVKLSGA